MIWIPPNECGGSGGGCTPSSGLPAAGSQGTAGNANNGLYGSVCTNTTAITQPCPTGQYNSGPLDISYQPPCPVVTD